MRTELRLEITSTEPFAEGHAFADTGAYELATGRAHYAIAPDYTPRIVDLEYAELNPSGLVEFAADICILRPVDWSRGNARLLFGYGNRGNKRELQFFNDAPAGNDPRTLSDAGNGFLMRRGYSVVWGAWEGDLLPGNGRMLLDVPTAHQDGAPITGKVRSEFIAIQTGVHSFPLSSDISTRSYPTASLDTQTASLTRRRYATDPRQQVPHDAWQFARIETGSSGLDAQGAQRAIVPSDTHIYLHDGFTPGWIYELVYTGRDPLVLGLGHVAVRELISFLRHATHDNADTPNPLGQVEKAYAWGRSQTGRCLRDFVYNGFNEDLQGRRVFDGVLPHVAGAGLMWMNHRFAYAVSPAGQEHEDHYNAADRFPFTYGYCTDPVTGKQDAILKRPDSDPLVIHTQTSTEYWQRRGSLVHTDIEGNDAVIPDNARVYMWSSSQHFADPNLRGPSHGICQQFCNIVQTSMFFRAMLDAMDRWATDAIPPPDNRIPLRADGTLVDAKSWAQSFPLIPGVQRPRGPNALPRLNFGERFAQGILDLEPPEIINAPAYPTFVPAVDIDGNDRAGVRAPMVRAPLGTYTGWNVRQRGQGHGAMHEFTGSYIPFPDTEAEAQVTQDPRSAILARYPTKQHYIDAIEEAAKVLVAEGFMLQEDLTRAVALATDWGRPLHSTQLD